jgi:hypothetical protein
MQASTTRAPPGNEPDSDPGNDERPVRLAAQPAVIDERIVS